MYITKYSLVIDTTSNNSSTGGYFYSDRAPNGLVYAIEYVQSTANALPTTATIQVYAGSTVRQFLSKTASTSFIVFPRRYTVDSTAAQIGASTDYPVAMFPVAGTNRLVCGITGGTSAATTGLVNVYIEGY